MKIKTILKKYKTERIDLTDVLLLLQKEGACPNLLNDDAGRWSLCCEGLQSIPDLKYPIDISISFYVEAQRWKPTIREAVLYYLEESL